jgi:membrane complex biogenesis BtpA family protein
VPQPNGVPRLVGMVHLASLPGAPRCAGSFQTVLDAALRDAEALVDGGMPALMLENFGDVPFYPAAVPAHTVAHLTAVACAIRQRFAVPLGINVLRNDGAAAVAVAAASGAQFVRVNVLTGARVTDQGLVQGIAHEVARLRAQLGAPIAVWADVDVKHSAPLAERPLAAEVHDTFERGLADAVIVSGEGTGRPVEGDKLAAVRAAAGRRPVLVGSGVTLTTVAQVLAVADGAIVGSALKPHLGAPIERERVRAMVRAAG